MESDGNYGYGRVDSEESSQRVVEGVGDEVTATFSSLLLLLIPIIIYAWNNRRPLIQSIHPASQALIAQLRERLGLNNQAEAGQPEPAAASNDANAGGESDGPRANYSGDRTCPICFAECRWAVLTNCGHLFCSQCILAYWNFTSPLAAVPCPVCRAPVNLLLTSYAEADPAAEGRAEADAAVNAYNRRFSGAPRSFLDYVRDLPVLLPHLFRELFSFSGLMMVFRLRVLCCLLMAFLYVISPLDIVPEGVFGLFGLLDDLFILFILAVYLAAAYRSFVANRA